MQIKIIIISQGLKDNKISGEEFESILDIMSTFYSEQQNISETVVQIEETKNSNAEYQWTKKKMEKTGLAKSYFHLNLHTNKNRENSIILFNNYQ